MPNIPLMELIDGAGILFTMARTAVSASLAGQPRQRGNVRHVLRRIHASLTPLFRRALTRKMKIADWGSPETAMAMPSTKFILLNATASLVAIGALVGGGAKLARSRLPVALQRAL